MENEVKSSLRILGFTGSVTLDLGVVKLQYRRLAKEYHPDKSGDSVRFMEIKKAYDLVLKWGIVGKVYSLSARPCGIKQGDHPLSYVINDQKVVYKTIFKEA